MRITRESGEVPEVKLNGEHAEFGRFYRMDANDENSGFTLMSKHAVNQLLNQKRKHHNQDQQLMNLNEITMVLWPKEGERGWKQYGELANDLQNVLARTKERVRFSCEITISYEPYRHALVKPGTDDFASPSAASSLPSAIATARGHLAS